MALPLRSLPTIQNWECRSCTNCCRGYVVRITQAERERIEAQGWDADPDLAGVELFADDEGSPHRWRLAQTSEEACVFLGEDNLCRIHSRFGAAEKPLACRLYPYVFVPTGDQWRVGLRYGCPSAVAGQGSPLSEQTDVLRTLASEIEARDGITQADLPDPPMPKGQTLAWSDVFQIVEAFSTIVAAQSEPLERRLRKCLALMRTLQGASFDKVKGRRLKELLSLLVGEIDTEVASVETVRPPGWIGRLLFRQLLSVYTRSDTGPSRRNLRFGRLGLLWAALRFAWGYGHVPKLNADLPNVRFRDPEIATDPLPNNIQEWLTRYYSVKLGSMQFCGRGNFGTHLWEGFASLLVTFPVICWLARAFHHLPREEAFGTAIRTVDDHFGANLLLGSPKQLFTIRLLADRGELDRLIAHYAR